VSARETDEVVAALRPMLAELVEQAQRPERPGWFSQHGGARYLGISVDTFIRLRARGKIKAWYLPGIRDARFRRSDLDRLMGPKRCEDAIPVEAGQ
jgi:excisionase family DNA binding protein